MKQRKLLVLGSDYCTHEIVLRAREMGLYVIAADLMQTSPTKQAAHEAWLLSTNDLDGLERACLEAGVDAVICGASDFNISNARLLCKRLGLPCHCEDDEVWEAVRSKRRFKALCRRCGAPVAEDYTVSDTPRPEELAQIRYPVVVKPSDKSGNRGMSYCDNEDELLKALQLVKEVSNEAPIIERRLVGREFNVHYALAAGEARLLYFSATHHEPTALENLYSFKCTTTAGLKQFLREVDEALRRVITAFGCREGVAWVDCMLDRDGSFYLLDFGHRLGGVMTYVPYEKITGFDTLRWMLECALGVRHKPEELPSPELPFRQGCAASYHLFALDAGPIARIEGLEELEAMPDLWIDLPKREGSRLRPGACSGLLGIYGKDIYEICRALERVNACFRLLDGTGRQLYLQYHDTKALITEYETGIRETGGFAHEADANRSAL